MGSPLTEKEQNATKKSEINSECLYNESPNYITNCAGVKSLEILTKEVERQIHLT